MPPPVAPVTREQAREVAKAIARGFLDNEVWVWMVPEERRRARLLPRYYRVAIRRLFMPRDGAWTTADRGGGALWAPPGRWPPSGREALWDYLALLPEIGVAGAGRGRELDRVIGSHHPREPHYYLQTLAIDPAHQRRGYGSALMRPLLERCDADGVGAYLETQRESNIPFYRRFGFAEREPIGVAGGPPLWPMWRPPGRGAEREAGSAGVAD